MNVPDEVIKILTDRKHLDKAVDKNVREGQNHSQAFNSVVKEVHQSIPGMKVHFSSAESYWTCRNRDYRNKKS